MNIFPKERRLRSRGDFERMRNSPFRFSGRFLYISIRPNRLTNSRLGITVTRRYGAAHARNRFKRLTRESFRLLDPFKHIACDVLVRPVHSPENISLQDFQSEFVEAFQRYRKKCDVSVTSHIHAQA